MSQSENDAARAQSSGDASRQEEDTLRAKPASLSSLGLTEAAGGARPKGGAAVPPPGYVVAGRYTVLEQLGQGGMGLVMLAYDVRLDRRVALKLLQPSVQAGHAMAQVLLLREAQVMARLNHPHVVSVYDAGMLEDGRLFIAMEYVQGGTLKQWLQREPREWRQVLTTYVAAGKGLVAAHREGLVHRDFKPENVLVGVDERARVTDFGVARVERPNVTPSPSVPLTLPLEESPSGRHDTLSTPGMVVGTPKYLAPELLKGQPADARSDLYAFCVALYEGLYGQPAFAGNRSAEQLQAKRTGSVQPPPANSPVPQWVHQVLLQGLSAEPQRRQASMEELLAQLENDPEVRRRYRRQQALLAGGALLVVGLSVALGWAYWQQQRSVCEDMASRLQGVWDEPLKRQVRQRWLSQGRPEDEAIHARLEVALEGYAQEWVRLRTRACEASQGRGEQPQELAMLGVQCLESRRSRLRALTEQLAAAGNTQSLTVQLQLVQGLLPLAYCEDAKALTAVVSLPEEPAMRARVQALQQQVDRLEALSMTGQLKQGLVLGEELLQQSSTLKHAPLQAQVHYWMGMLRSTHATAQAAEDHFKESLVLAAQAGDEVLPAKAWSALAYLWVEHTGRYQQAQPLSLVLRVALVRVREATTRADVLESLAALLYYQGRFEESLEANSQALALRESQPKPNVFAIANSLRLRTSTLLRMARYEEASADYESIRTIYERQLGLDDSWLLGAVVGKLRVLTHQGRFQQALELGERCQAIRERLLAAGETHVAALPAFLGSLMFEMGRYEEALTITESFLRQLEEELGPEHIELAEDLVPPGRALVRLGQRERAEQYLERARRLQEANTGAAHYRNAFALHGLGELRLAQGKPLQALPLLEQALAVAEPGLQPEVRFTLAQALWAAGKERARARKLAQQSQEYYRRLGHQPKLAQVSAWLESHAQP